MKLATLAAAIAFTAPSALQAEPASLGISFCPSARVYAYPLESHREIQSVLLHNALIINRSRVDMIVTGIDIEVMSKMHVVEARHLEGPELKRAAGNGVGLQTSGAIKAVPFEFCDGPATDPNVKLTGPALGPGQGLLIFQQLLAFQGEADALRLRVHALAGSTPVEAAATLPVRTELSKTVFRFPLRGVWYLEQGATPHTGHRWFTTEEFALDIGKLGANGLEHSGDGDRLSDYYAYGADVLAAAEGHVIAEVDGIPENTGAMQRPGESETAYELRHSRMQAALLSRGPAAALGNYVVIAHHNGEYSLYAHLRPGSIRVKSGDEVKEGQAIGRLGSTGNSTGPHLHFQVCDGPSPVDCAGVPIAFKDIELPEADYPRPVQSGDVVVAH
jgi:murein DD-endopeptidase MepM/ murein hydrolase activator NlpD